MAKPVVGEIISTSCLSVFLIPEELSVKKQSVKHSANKFSNILYRVHFLKKRSVFCMKLVCIAAQHFWGVILCEVQIPVLKLV